MHRRSTFNLENHSHFLTFTCFRRHHLFNNDEIRRATLRYWSYAKSKLNFRILSYVIMTNHVHLLIWPEDAEYSMRQILQQLKAPVAKWAIERWRASGNSILHKVETMSRGTKTWRFWQAGGGYDRNIVTPESLYKAIEYIEMNPVRKGLVELPDQWLWSSAYARHENRDVVLNVGGFEGIL